MLGENSWKGPRELSLPRDFTPLLLKRNVSFDVSERGRIPHFLLKFFHFYVSRFNNLKLQSPQAAAGEWRTHDSWFIIVCFPSLPASRSLSSLLPANMAPSWEAGARVAVNVLHCGLWWDWRCIILHARYSHLSPSRPIPWIQATHPAQG